MGFDWPLATMHPSLDHTSHRPWPLPQERWLWRQSWGDLAFIHYRVDANALRALLPSSLKLQEFDGSAWVAIVPFRMRDVMRGTLPSPPPLSSFPEVNLRTYVECNGRPGVWFLSLDADCWPIVLGGRLLYGIPYFKARMAHGFEEGWVQFESVRFRTRTCFRASYRPIGPTFYPKAGTFEHWVAERYCLYSNHGGELLGIEVHHRPWPLQPAEAQIHECGLWEAAGLETPQGEMRCHYSAGVEVVSYAAYRPVERTEEDLVPAPSV